MPTEVRGCRELRLDPSSDHRGGFLKLFQAGRFAADGIELGVQELFVSRSRPGVVRGLHFQAPPADVAKLVSCLEGAVLDVVVDLRVDSPTFRRHSLVELSAAAANALYVPCGCAHGFLVTPSAGACDALVLYAQSGEHDAEREGGVLWSSVGVDWPIDDADVILSARDATFAALDAFDSPFRMGGS